MPTYIFQNRMCDSIIKMIDAENEIQALQKLEERLKKGFVKEDCYIQFDNVLDYEFYGMM